MGFVGVEINGIEELQRKLKRLPKEAQDAGADEAYDYLLRVFKLYPPPKRISRKQAYGVTFFNKYGDHRQQKFFFAALRSGAIVVPYRRSQRLRKAWKKYGEGIRAFIANDTPYAKFMYDPDQQSRMSALIGWETTDETLRKREKQVLRKFDAGVKNAIRKLGLG